MLIVRIFPGSRVFLFGHGMFTIEELSSPSIHKGIVSKIIFSKESDLILRNSPVKYGTKSEKNVPVILQTTCLAYAGSSGAPIISFDHEKGNLNPVQ